MSKHSTHSPIEAIRQWCRGLIRPQSTFGACEAEGIDRIAHDIGLSTAELHELAARREKSADLLDRRLEVLDLNRDEVSHADGATLRDMERVCSMCDCKKRCARDMASNPDDPIWKDYCANAQTLAALGALPWATRREW
jgi:hypothetical protein